MKFKFPLEQLLKVRARDRDQAQREYIKAHDDVEFAKRDLEEMHRSIGGARERASRLMIEGGDITGFLNQTDFYIAGQEVRIKLQKERIRELASVEEQKHAILVEAAREHKKVEKLKERSFRRFREEKRDRELRAMDDLTTMRFKREDQ